jgi:hypothetical protein
VKRPQRREGFGPTIDCACGCKKQLTQFDFWGRERKYLNGHNINRAWQTGLYRKPTPAPYAY